MTSSRVSVRAAVSLRYRIETGILTSKRFINASTTIDFWTALTVSIRDDSKKRQGFLGCRGCFELLSQSKFVNMYHE